MLSLPQLLTTNAMKEIFIAPSMWDTFCTWLLTPLISVEHFSASNGNDGRTVGHSASKEIRKQLLSWTHRVDLWILQSDHKVVHGA
jgi:hypothetical protein